MAAVPASAFWWQWPWNRMRRPRGVVRRQDEPAVGDGLERAVPPAAAWRPPRPAPSGRRAAAPGTRRAGSAGRTAPPRRSARPGRPRRPGGPPCPPPSAGPDRAAPWTGWPGRSSPRPRDRTRHPASSSSSIAARPTAGSVKVVKESARKISSPWDAGAAGPRPAPQPAAQVMPLEPGQRPGGADPQPALRRPPGGPPPAGEIGQRERGRAQPVQRPDGPEACASGAGRRADRGRRRASRSSAPPCRRRAGTRSCRPCTPGRGRGCRAAGRQPSAARGSGRDSA